jgi:hypothetical protein
MKYVVLCFLVVIFASVFGAFKTAIFVMCCIIAYYCIVAIIECAKEHIITTKQFLFYVIMFLINLGAFGDFIVH